MGIGSRDQACIGSRLDRVCMERGGARRGLGKPAGDSSMKTTKGCGGPSVMSVMSVVLHWYGLRVHGDDECRSGV